MFFFFNDTATTEIYTLSLHDALPIWRLGKCHCGSAGPLALARVADFDRGSKLLSLRKNHAGESHAFNRRRDRKSTRLNSSHGYISYAVFCLKKKNERLPVLRRRNLEE